MLRLVKNARDCIGTMVCIHRKFSNRIVRVRSTLTMQRVEKIERVSEHWQPGNGQSGLGTVCGQFFQTCAAARGQEETIHCMAYIRRCYWPTA